MKRHLFETIKIAVEYGIDGKKTEEFPYNSMAEIKPVYKEFRGWNRDINYISTYEEFPQDT